MQDKNVPIAIHTEAIDHHISGGILCIVETLNGLQKLGYNVMAFVNSGDLASKWIKADFPILSSDSDTYRNFKGILVTPYSVTAKAVNDHENAKHRLYWVHSHESFFTHNGQEWCNRADESYRLPNLKLFCVSNYLQILMLHMYNRDTARQTVTGGVDVNLFKCTQQKERPTVGFLGRSEAVRGCNIAKEALIIANNRLQALKQPGFDAVMITPSSDRSQISKGFQSLDVYVDASLLAGFPIPILESMSCGTIPIATYYGAPDVIANNCSGYIVAPNDAESIAIRIVALCLMGQRERQKIANEAFRMVNQNYRWREVTLNFLKAVTELTEEEK